MSDPAGKAPGLRSPWPTALAVLVVIVVVWAIASAARSNQDSDDEPTGPTMHVVLYELEGNTEYAEVTMRTPTGIEQISPDVPLTTTTGERGLTIRTTATSWSPYISAQNPGATGRITCRITIDSVVVSENTSTSAYGIATCHS